MLVNRSYQYLINTLKALSLRVADFQARLLLSIIFWLIVPILALIFKLQDKPKNGWIKWSYMSESLEEVRKQF